MCGLTREHVKDIVNTLALRHRECNDNMASKRSKSLYSPMISPIKLGRKRVIGIIDKSNRKLVAYNQNAVYQKSKCCSASSCVHIYINILKLLYIVNNALVGLA